MAVIVASAGAQPTAPPARTAPTATTPGTSSPKMAAVAGCASPSEAYAYDDAGNHTSALVAGSTRTFTHTADGQLTSCTNPACTITYDSTGRTSAWTDAGIT